jgi:hypothetical protein
MDLNALTSTKGSCENQVARGGGEGGRQLKNLKHVDDEEGIDSHTPALATVFHRSKPIANHILRP